MASSFLILRFVIPMPDNTELTVTALEASLGACGGMEMAGAKRFMIRPFVALRFQLDWACRER
jgi:sulfopyruvate decarboxylase TPP-binding subunit